MLAGVKRRLRKKKKKTSTTENKNNEHRFLVMNLIIHWQVNVAPLTNQMKQSCELLAFAHRLNRISKALGLSGTDPKGFREIQTSPPPPLD